ncbi:hypothetical protein RJ641_022886 [Dillenia turbinata]|uniref:Ribosomal protein L34e superfamily protein n=1 Tax=Dillenia turbinata TaxID=194707 RepID=A0AAN8UD84_9MAGN
MVYLMASFLAQTESRQSNQSSTKSRKIPNSSTPSCHHRPRCAAIDVLILIAVMLACGYLIFPYIDLIINLTIKIFTTVHSLIKHNIPKDPMIYLSLGVSFCCASVAVWGIVLFTSRKCGNPNCRGLRNAAEFDIQLETEECVKNSSNLAANSVKKGLFELPRDHHKELEAELKKMAPVNGRAVLVFRTRCGCSVGFDAGTSSFDFGVKVRVSIVSHRQTPEVEHLDRVPK